MAKNTADLRLCYCMHGAASDDDCWEATSGPGFRCCCRRAVRHALLSVACTSREEPKCTGVVGTAVQVCNWDGSKGRGTSSAAYFV